VRSVKIAIAWGFIASAVVLTALAAELESQKSIARSVTVVVTPQNLSAEATSWDFKTVLDTHSGDLSDDLLKSAALIDSGGTRYTPIAWDGAPPGGHHREGLLRFKPILPRPQSIELQIARTGEDTPRSFRWTLK
jgi:hypothetical protein